MNVVTIKPYVVGTLFVVTIIQIVNFKYITDPTGFISPNVSYLNYACRDKPLKLSNISIGDTHEDNYIFVGVSTLVELTISECYLRTIQKVMFEAAPNLEVISIPHNQINSIEYLAFGGLSHLKYLDVSYNELKTFETWWFDKSSRIETLLFRQNKIRQITLSTFRNMTGLKTLDLSSNDIFVIEPGSFDDLWSIEHLALAHNKLRMIPVDLFPNRFRVKVLDLAGNLLNFLPARLMETITVETFLVDLNPWKCPCLDTIYYWLFTKNGTTFTRPACDTDNVPVCAVPTTYSFTCLEYVDEELTNRYFDALRNGSKSLESCARLDYNVW